MVSPETSAESEWVVSPANGSLPAAGGYEPIIFTLASTSGLNPSKHHFRFIIQSSSYRGLGNSTVSTPPMTINLDVDSSNRADATMPTVELDAERPVLGSLWQAVRIIPRDVDGFRTRTTDNDANSYVVVGYFGSKAICEITSGILWDETTSSHAAFHEADCPMPGLPTTIEAGGKPWGRISCVVL